METKELRISIPKGFEIDTEASDLSKGIVKFKEKPESKLPKSWEELVIIGGYWVNGDSTINMCSNISTFSHNKNMFPTKEYAEAALALAQLLQLREKYNDGWVPDWDNINIPKYTIFVHRNKLVTDINLSAQKVLSFKTKELAEKFLATFKPLLEIAKPLL